MPIDFSTSDSFDAPAKPLGLLDSAGAYAAPVVADSGVESNGPDSSLKLDKLAIVLDPASPEEEVDVVKWRQLLVACAIDLEKGKSLLPGISPGVRGAYRAAFQILAPDEDGFDPKTFALVQVGPRAKGAAHSVRIEWNPSKVPPGFLKRIAFVCSTGLLFDFGPALLAASVTRLDIAVDLPCVRIGDFAWDARKKRLRALYLRAGELQTVYAGSRRENCVVVYDKAAEMKLPPGVSLTRAEVRLRPNKKIADLDGIENPFAWVRVYDVLGSKLPMMTEADKLAFHDSVQQRGLARALVHRSSAHRAAIREAIEAARPDFWAPARFWEAFGDQLAETFGISVDA